MRPVRDDAGQPLRLWRLLVRVLVVPGLAVAVALGGTMAVLGALQARSRAGAVPALGGRRGAPAHARKPPAGQAASFRSRARPTPTQGAAPRLGVYAGPGDTAGAAAFSARFPTKVTAAFDYLDDRSWSTIASPSWLLERWGPTGDTMTYAVPMLPETGGSLAAGARGAYDGEFRELGALLVAHGEATATLVIGWSPLERGLPWSVSGPAEAADYVAYFRQIARTMRSVPGARFVFAFQPGPVSTESGGIGPGRLYPGNAYVGVVAIFVFDRLAPPSPLAGARRWAEIRSAPFGPSWTARFAARLHRRIVVDGLALVPVAADGGGDDGAFVGAFLAWARRVGVGEVIVWDDGSWALSPARDPHGFARLEELSAKSRLPLDGAGSGRAKGSAGTPRS